MKNIVVSFFLTIFLFSCNTTNQNSISDEVKITSSPAYLIDEYEEFITDESIKTYDLTVLKGGTYPQIENDTPFTDVELEILKNSSGLELEATVEVAHYFKYFLRDKRELLELWLDNSRSNIPFIRDSFAEAGLPDELIYLPFLESGYNVKAYSRVGAGGIWQFMPKTARSYGLKVNWWSDERRSPRLATPYAIKHISYLYNLFGDWYTALAAYNAGEGRIARAMDSVQIYDYFELIKTDALPRETRKYVPQYLAIVKIMKNLDKLGFKEIDWNYSHGMEIVTIPAGTDLYEFSNGINLKWSDFTTLNPEFRRKVSDPSQKTTILIPENKLEITKKFLTNYKPIINENGYSYYTVRSGDSWWYLSTLTNYSITTLKRLNNFYSNNLAIGQRILLPGKNYTPSAKASSTSTIQTASYIKSETELQTHTVRSGETMSSISIYYNIKLTSLLQENNMTSRSVLHVGQIIRLPGYPIEKSQPVNSSTPKSTGNYYTVQYGDSVWVIAQKTRIPYQQLLTLNNLNKNSKLRIGEKILLY